MKQKKIMKKIKYASQNIDYTDLKSVNKSLQSEFITQGPNSKIFENHLKKNLNQSMQFVFQWIICS